MNLQYQESLIVFLSSLLVLGCAPIMQPISKLEITYSEIGNRKTGKDTIVTYQDPVITLLGVAEQAQTKGGVTITCTIVPFSLDKKESVTEIPFYRSPSKSDYDVIETKRTSDYSISPDEVLITVQIKNNQSHVLKMRDCAIAMIIDNIQYSIPQDNIVQWENTNVMSNFSTSYTLRGPKLSALRDPKSIEIFINDIPVSFDDAGNITKRENFNWVFSCHSEPKTVQDRITYSYDEKPVHKEQCQACNGQGYFKDQKTCTSCKGSGRVLNPYDNKVYNCSRCSGTGIETSKIDCKTCYGLGIRSYPKSPLPPIADKVVWKGWKVQVLSVPAGAAVQVIDTKTGTYKKVGETPTLVDWYASPTTQFPIILELQNQKVKVLPINQQSGTQLTKVNVDFMSVPAQVSRGTRAE